MRGKARAIVGLRRVLHRGGFDLVRFVEDTDLLRRRLRLMEHHGIDVIFDVGANGGQYAQTMRALGYRGRIVSFEPLPDAFRQLRLASDGDDLWTVVNVALGEDEREATINVAENSQSSSMLPLLPAHVAAAPDSAYVGQVTVPMRTLDTIIDECLGSRERLFVKIDTQGYEDKVLLGTGQSDDRIVGLQVELSLVPLYAGQRLIEDMVTMLRGRRFVLMSLEPGFWQETTGQLLQADGIFFRPGLLGANGS